MRIHLPDELIVRSTRRRVHPQLRDCAAHGAMTSNRLATSPMLLGRCSGSRRMHSMIRSESSCETLGLYFVGGAMSLSRRVSRLLLRRVMKVGILWPLRAQ